MRNRLMVFWTRGTSTDVVCLKAVFSWLLSQEKDSSARSLIVHSQDLELSYVLSQDQTRSGKLIFSAAAVLLQS
jgi:hypothetical protein